MTSIKILLIEDDAVLNDQLSELLTEAGYLVDRCFDGEAGLSQASTLSYQLIILDVMLPKLDGFSVLRLLRKTSKTPVIMLTAKGAEEERIKGFSHGADDYLIKPFNTTELLLRIEALLRRTQGEKELDEASHLEIKLDQLCLNKVNQSVSVGNHTKEFTPIEFRLIWMFAQCQGDILSKAFLYRTVLNRTLGPHDRSLDMHLSRVRKKLNAIGWHGDRLKTVHGKGYCLS